MRVGSGLDFGELARRLTNRHALFARRRLNIVVKPVDRLGHLLYLALQGLNLYFSLLAHHLTLISLAGVLRQELLLRNVPVSHSPAAPELGDERILGLPLRKEGLHGHASAVLRLDVCSAGVACLFFFALSFHVLLRVELGMGKLFHALKFLQLLLHLHLLKIVGDGLELALQLRRLVV